MLKVGGIYSVENERHKVAIIIVLDLKYYTFIIPDNSVDFKNEEINSFIKELINKNEVLYTYNLQSINDFMKITGYLGQLKSNIFNRLYNKVVLGEI